MRLTPRDILDLGTLLHNLGDLIRSTHVHGDASTEPVERLLRTLLCGPIRTASDQDPVIEVAMRRRGRIWDDISFPAQERQNTPLVSIESRVRVERERSDGAWYYRPEPLEAAYTMPVRDRDVSLDEKNSDRDGLLAKLLDAFLNEAEKLEAFEDFRSFYDTLYALLEKYTTRVASSAGVALSLFDHARSVAAVARCLEDAGEENRNSVLLVKGDVSGIQTFIYRSIRSIENPAKQLRGRSVYVGLLSDTIAQYYLDELGLNRANLIFSGGGHFLLLAPHTGNTIQVLDRLERELNIWLLHTFGGALQIVTASTSATPSEALHNFDEVYHRLADELNRAKRRKNWSVLDAIFSGEPLPLETGSEAAFRTLGERLPKLTCLIEVKADHEPAPDRLRFPVLAAFPICGTYWFGADDPSLPALLQGLASNDPHRVTVWRLNDTDFLNDLESVRGLSYPAAFGFKFMGLYAPRNSRGDVLEFKELAAMDRTSESGLLEYRLLGVLRMDVDDLGSLFALGLRETAGVSRSYTMSRVAMLSRNLHHFFAGNLNLLAEQYGIYIAYAGGDDVFAVGSWVNTLAFARAIRSAFADFACHNPNVTLSGGLVFTKPSYPVPLSAEMAGHREELAKKAEGKDHVNVFNRTVSWRELDVHMEMAEGLLAIVEDTSSDDAANVSKEKALPRSFIHRLIGYTRSCFNRKGQLDPGRFHRVDRLLHYAFARRNVDAKEMATHTLGFKTKLATYLLDAAALPERSRRFENFDIIASYVLLKTRTSKE